MILLHKIKSLTEALLGKPAAEQRIKEIRINAHQTWRRYEEEQALRQEANRLKSNPKSCSL